MARVQYASDEPAVRRRLRWEADVKAYAESCEHTGRRLREKVHAATADMIRERLQPNLMITLTFPAGVRHPDRRRWHMGNFLEECLPAGRYVYAVEAHRSGLLHGHGVAHEERIRRLSLHDAWHWRTGGFALVEQVRPGTTGIEHVTAYILKYITRGDQGELEFGRNFGKAPAGIRSRGGSLGIPPIRDPEGGGI